jgi:putative DNA primase/helicase
VHSESVPAHVRERFVQARDHYYFATGELAFRDHGVKLSTRSENAELVRGLVQIAQVRGWHEITVSGTERFRKQAWREASAIGLAVRGYVPSDFERARVIRTLAQGAGLREGSGASAPRTAETPTAQPAAAPEDPRTRSIPRAPLDRTESAPHRVALHSPQEAAITGTLLAHGRASYLFHPHEEASYYVKLRTEYGERMLWGKDLERALGEAATRPQIGDEVGVRANGRDPVSVKAREHDESGRVVSEKDLNTHRNRWVVERREFFDSRTAAACTFRDPKVDAQRGTDSHPELLDGYITGHLAEQFAERHITQAEDRKKFVALVREAIADSVARGEVLSSVRVRERKAPRDRDGSRERSIERERSPGLS